MLDTLIHPDKTNQNIGQDGGILSARSGYGGMREKPGCGKSRDGGIRVYFMRLIYVRKLRV